MIYTYWDVMEYDENKIKRRIYTFDNESSAHDMVEFIVKNDFMPPDIGVEKHEVTT